MTSQMCTKMWKMIYNDDISHQSGRGFSPAEGQMFVFEGKKGDAMFVGGNERMTVDIPGVNGRFFETTGRGGVRGPLGSISAWWRHLEEEVWRFDYTRLTVNNVLRSLIKADIRRHKGQRGWEPGRPVGIPLYSEWIKDTKTHTHTQCYKGLKSPHPAVKQNIPQVWHKGRVWTQAKNKHTTLAAAIFSCFLWAKISS